MKVTIHNKIADILNKEFNPVSLKIINESFMHNVPKESESHFKIVIVSNDFMNIQTIKRHKSIYKALGKIMDEIHALSIHTFDEDEYKKNPMVIDSPQCAHKTT